MSDESGYSLALPFDRDDPAFIDGVEIGRLWERAKGELGPFAEYVHGRNAEMVLRVAEATDRQVRSVELDETWVEVHFEADDG